MNNIANIGLFSTGEAKYGKGGESIEKIIETFGGLEIKNNISVIVSDNWNGGVREKAYNNGLEFYKIRKFPLRGDDGEFSEKDKEQIKIIYEEIIEKYNLEFIFFSGWLKYIEGLTPNKTVSIHSGPLTEEYTGLGMYGMNIHNKVWQDYIDGKINRTCITMHYVTKELDSGPIIVQMPVSLTGCNSPEDVKNRVSDRGQLIQWKITQMVMCSEITWSGIEGEPVIFPKGFDGGVEIDLMDELSYNDRGF